MPELSGTNWNNAVREMVDSDPVVGGAMMAIEMMLRRADWWFDPADETPAAQEVNDFVADAMFRDLDPPWEEMLSSLMSFLPYGWALFEIVYKRRHGEQADPAESSRFDDGKIGWQTWAIRPQESRYRWDFDAYGRPLTMVQMAPPDFVPVAIPLERAMLFRTGSRKNTPEGFPLLRRSFRPYLYRRRLEKLEGIGAERDLAGIPVGEVPEMMTRADAPAAVKASYQTFIRTLNNIKQNTQATLVIPQAYDPATKQPLYKVSLLQSAGARQFDTNTLINRYGQDIVMSLMAGFLWMGRASIGSYALAQTMTQMFNQALQSWLDIIGAVVTEQAVRRLLLLNGMDPELTPQLKHSRVESVDLKDMSLYLTALGANGFDLTGDPAILRQLLTMVDLPIPAETDEEADQAAGGDVGSEETDTPPAATPAAAAPKAPPAAAKAAPKAIPKATPKAPPTRAARTGGRAT